MPKPTGLTPHQDVAAGPANSPNQYGNGIPHYGAKPPVRPAPRADGVRKDTRPENGQAASCPVQNIAKPCEHLNVPHQAKAGRVLRAELGSITCLAPGSRARTPCGEINLAWGPAATAPTGLIGDEVGTEAPSNILDYARKAGNVERQGLTSVGHTRRRRTLLLWDGPPWVWRRHYVETCMRNR
jgi:hypothetical protein